MSGYLSADVVEPGPMADLIYTNPATFMRDKGKWSVVLGDFQRHNPITTSGSHWEDVTREDRTFKYFEGPDIERHPQGPFDVATPEQKMQMWKSLQEDRAMVML